jgi:hypothetical protein
MSCRRPTRRAAPPGRRRPCSIPWPSASPARSSWRRWPATSARRSRRCWRRGRSPPAARAEARRLILLIDELLEALALEAGRLRPTLAPISAHGLLGVISARLAALGIACGRRIILQPDADPAWLLDTPRLLRAVSLLAERAVAECGGAAWGEVSVDAGAGGARLDLVIRPGLPRPAAEEEPTPEALLPLSVARRMLGVQGGTLDSWALPGGGLRLRLGLGGAWGGQGGRA